MKLSKEIRDAVSRLVGMGGWSGARLAREVGVTESAVSRWRTGTCDSIEDGNWERLAPFVLPLMGKAGPSFSIKSTKGERRVPIMGNAQAAGYEPAFEPLTDWVAGFDGETTGWPEEDPYEPGFFCLRVDGDSMLPDYPPGTTLYVAAGTFPERGDIVVARLADCGEVVVKEYHRRNGIVELRSTNPAGKSYVVDTKAEPGRIIWLWPVLEARINLRRQRWEKKK